MPGKGHKVASHQARLGQRRRRQARPVATAPVAPTPVRVEEADEPRTGEQPKAAAPSPTVAHQPVSPRPGPRARAEYRPAVLQYIGPELRRIGVLGGTALVVLIVLSIVLR